MKRISVQNLSKSYRIGKPTSETVLARVISFVSGVESKQTIHVLNEISFEVKSGEIVGIIGKNGTGKTTLLQIVAEIIKPDSGMVETNGKVISLINLRVGLHDYLTAEENIYLCASFFGVSYNEIKAKVDSIFQFAGLEMFVATKIFQFSLGMRQRLVFSIAMHCDPSILLLDEIFEVGDDEFRNKSAKHMHMLAEKGGSILLVSNELDVISKHCDRAIWIDGGIKRKEDSPQKVLQEYSQAEE